MTVLDFARAGRSLRARCALALDFARAARSLQARGARLLPVLGIALAVGACAGRPTPHPELERWRRTATELRELDFTDEVTVRWIRADDLREILHEEHQALLPPGGVEAYRDGYAALGVLPRNLDLLETLIGLQTDQLVGLYSARLRTLYVLGERPGDGGYDPSVILVHELVHALQHQHFPDLVRILQGLHNNDDVVLAMASALEGDASFTMLGVPDTDESMQRTPAAAQRLSEAMWVDVEFPTGQLAAVPHLLRVSLIFPYAEGTLLAARSFESAGNAGIDALLRDPPLSTLRVRHPDDAHPVEFARLPLEALARDLEPRGCRLGHDDVAGVVTLGVLFEDYDPQQQDPQQQQAPLDPLLRRWSGDRFLHVACAAGPELIWFTRWQNEAAAREFGKQYARIAAAIAQRVGFAAAPAVHLDGPTALILSPGVASERELLLRESEVRSYANWKDWVADGCFPDPACP